MFIEHVRVVISVHGYGVDSWRMDWRPPGFESTRLGQFHAREAFLIGAHLSPLPTASTHVTPDPVRTRKLLLKRSELQGLIGAVERRGYTIVPLELYWKNGRAKVQVGLAKGKKQHDKRAVQKERDWQRDKARLLRRG